MNAVLKQWIGEPGEQLEISQSQEINEEAISNMMAYGMPREAVSTYSIDELREFLTVHLEAYRTKENSTPMSFYSWFGE